MRGLKWSLGRHYATNTAVQNANKKLNSPTEGIYTFPARGRRGNSQGSGQTTYLYPS